MSEVRPAVLVIAGSDSSGGAGLLRDVQTLSACNVDALCAITAVTSQTHQRVSGIEFISPSLVHQQITDAFATRHIDAVKIGMLGNAAIVQAVARALRNHSAIPVVLDPVILSSSGGELLDAAGLQALLDELLPLTTLVTPNLPELMRLTNEAEAQASLQQRAELLLQRGAQAVLVKGGHADGDESIDWLVTAGIATPLVGPRVPTQRRGTGCTLASAIAAQLAGGASLRLACAFAKQYVFNYLSAL